jgi:hypothetical protein
MSVKMMKSAPTSSATEIESAGTRIFDPNFFKPFT